MELTDKARCQLDRAHHLVRRATTILDELRHQKGGGDAHEKAVADCKAIASRIAKLHDGIAKL